MNFFHNFTTPLWGIFFGNLLLLFCSLFYLAWWVVSFRPDASAGPGGGFFITAAFIAGLAAIVLMSGGISSLSQNSKSVPVWIILLGITALFLILLPVTSIAFHRVVTSELIIIHIWAALELCAVVVLYGTGRFGTGRALTLTALVLIAFVIGLICYVIHYRLDSTAAYWNGMVPLAVDSFVAAAFLGVLAVS